MGRAWAGARPNQWVGCAGPTHPKWGKNLRPWASPHVVPGRVWHASQVMPDPCAVPDTIILPN